MAQEAELERVLRQVVDDLRAAADAIRALLPELEGEWPAAPALSVPQPLQADQVGE